MPSLRNWRKKRVTKSDDKKVPALRFKGFTDDWEQRKPNNFLTESKIIGHKGNQAKKLTVKLWGKGIQEKQNAYSGSNKTQYYIRKSGQLMYGKLDFLHAAFGIVPNKLNNYESTIDSPAFDVKNANSSFLLNLFLRKNFYLYYGERANGSRKARRIHEKDFLMMPIKIPSIQEQNKIVVLIKIINKLITLQQRKLEQLNLLQRALLQRIFANRNLQPDLRFTNFSGAWEQHKLGNMANILRGASPRPIKDKKWFDTNSRIGWIRISDVTSQNGRVYTLGQHLSKKGQEKTHVVSSQTLLLSIAASVGYPVITYVETGVHDGFIIFDKPKFNLDFMFFKLQSIQNIWSKYGQPGSQVNINSSIVANTSISIPNIKEQKKISILLKKIEENIHLQQNKINKLQELKRSFLQNMFI